MAEGRGGVASLWRHLRIQAGSVITEVSRTPKVPMVGSVASTALPLASHYSQHWLDMSTAEVAHAEYELVRTADDIFSSSGALADLGSQ